MVKRLRFQFEPWGLGLFLLVMLPNFIWFAVPAPDDILRSGGAETAWDTAASVLQVLLAVSLCALKNPRAERVSLRSPLFLISLLLCIGYWGVWVLYYAGITSPPILLLLCLLPCSTFLVFSLYRKNGCAVAFGMLFTLCHTVSTVLNFLI